jgi:hypothetical protein
MIRHQRCHDWKSICPLEKPDIPSNTRAHFAVLLRYFLITLFATFGNSARANCGSVFCALNTDWSSQGVWTEPGGRFDLRYEFIDQGQPRVGTRDVTVGEIPQHHDEVRTINRNWIAEFDYTFKNNWGLRLQLPLVDRSHSHIHNDIGGPEQEAWNFTDVGDARVTGRYVFGGNQTPGTGRFGVTFGVKLPTGKFDVANDDGDVAERSLQPGTGTTDVTLGAFYSGPFDSTASWFGSLYWYHSLIEREEYKPGDRFGIDFGITTPVAAKVAMLLQINGLWKGHESGSNGEPDLTGGTFVFISPGASVNLGENTQLYGFVQFPMYQNVRGVQLVADWALAAGLSYRF